MGGTLALHASLGTWHRKIDCLIALSQFSAGKFLEAGVPLKKMRVIPNGVPIPLESKKMCGPANPQLLYLGRLSQEKGVLTLLSGFQLFAKKFPAIPLHIAGDGPLRPAVEAFKNENPDLKIVVHGFVGAEMKQKLLQSSSLLVFPSECYENCPYTILEAMACGVPVVGADIGGIPELVVPGESGWLFKPGLADSLGHSLEQAFSEMPTWPELRQSTYSRAKGKYNLDNWSAAIESIYSDVLLHAESKKYSTFVP
jgi:glycosyltransferase involved in cell wall biosynthesis